MDVINNTFCDHPSHCLLFGLHGLHGLPPMEVILCLRVSKALTFTEGNVRQLCKRGITEHDCI